MRPRTILAAAVIVLLGGPGVVGCGSDGGADGDGGTTEPVVIEVTVADGDITPKGERVQVATGQSIELVVTADTPGGLHVHSSPEQELDYEAGTSTHEIVIDKPGLVEVEAHDPPFVVVQLEVR